MSSSEIIKTESDFREYLKSKNFHVNEKHDNENGIDIVAIKNGQYFLIEVKKTTPSKDGYRVRLDQNTMCDFTIVIGSNGLFYPKETQGRPYQKVVDFMDSI